MRGGNVGKIFVQPDNPAFLEREVEIAADTFDIEKANAKPLLDEFREKQKHFSTAPFDPDGNKVRFFPGGFTIWSGMPGAGKTTLLRQLACHLLFRNDVDLRPGHGVFLCSLEEEPRDVLVRHAQVACGTDLLTYNAFGWCLDLWANRVKLWNYRPIEADARHQKILAAIRVMARDHGVRHAIIDSLMCLDVAANDFEAQRLFAMALTRTAAASGVHIHLVAHPRKPYRGDTDLDISDVAGSADLGRKADNVLFVKRAKDEPTSTNGDCTPMRIAIRKQRYGTGWIGELEGWFHRRFRQFVRDPHQEQSEFYLPAKIRTECRPQFEDALPL